MIIGSTAMKYWFPNEREPKDVDKICPPEWQIMSTADNFWDDRLEEYLSRKMWIGGYADADDLYTIKVSHSYWELPNHSWWKHIRDVVFLKQQGATIIQPFHDILYRIWEDKHGSKKMAFKEKGAFFKDAVTRIYDHDSIHDSVAYGEAAMYIQTLKRQGHTAVDMDYVRAMSHEAQVKLFREEVCATALERIMIPNQYRGSAGAAYLWALRRTITSLTRGWSAQFIVENYESFSRPCNYVVRHLANKEKLILL